MTTDSEVPIGPIVDSTKISAAKVNGISTPMTTASADHSSADGEVPSPDSGRTVVATADQPGDEPKSENDIDAAGLIVSKMETEVSDDVAAETEDEIIKVLSYHQDADMYIRMKPGVILLARSTLIAAASPAFQNLIENKKPGIFRNGKPVLDLTGCGHDAYGLDVLLSVIHFKFHGISTQHDVSQLYSIARFAEKYDATHLLVPYMEKWMAGLDYHIVMKGDENDDDKTLFLAWVFGEGRWFTRMLSRVAHKATVDENGVLLDAHGQPWMNQGLPSIVLDLITKTRYDGLTKIVAAIEVPLRELMGGIKAKYCRTKNTDAEVRESCQHQQLGSLVSALSSAGLLPFPNADKYHGSVAALAKTALAIKVTRYKVPGVAPHLDCHSNCGINHMEAVNTAMREEIRLGGEVIQQLALRARKSGAAVAELFRDMEGTDGRRTSPAVVENLRLDRVHYKQMVDEPLHADNAMVCSDRELKLEDREI